MYQPDIVNFDYYIPSTAPIGAYELTANTYQVCEPAASNPPAAIWMDAAKRLMKRR